MKALTLLGFLQGNEVIWIVVAILVLFGGSKIPELMKGFGSGIKEFKKATKEDEPEEKKDPKELEK